MAPFDLSKDPTSDFLRGRAWIPALLMMVKLEVLSNFRELKHMVEMPCGAGARLAMGGHNAGGLTTRGPVTNHPAVELWTAANKFTGQCSHARSTNRRKREWRYGKNSSTGILDMDFPRFHKPKCRSGHTATIVRIILSYFF
jgi:hypothetical protein